MDLDQFLSEALSQQLKRRRSRRRVGSTADDYAKRLQEKALYRRLINESDIAQDGIRFIWYFGSTAHSEGRSLGDWRQRIDREMAEDRRRTAKAIPFAGPSLAGDRREELAREVPPTDEQV